MRKSNLTILAIVFIIMSTWINSVYFLYPNSKKDFAYNNDEISNLESQIFSVGDFKPILEEEKQGLGNITVIDLNFNESGFFNNSEEYPNLDDDLISGALNMTYLGINFTETKNIAQIDNLDDTITDSNKVTMILNETIHVRYNYSVPNAEGYLIYGPRLYPCKLIQLQILNNGSFNIEEVPEANYSIDDSNFLVFNYKRNFKKECHNFTLHLIWEYNLTVLDWLLSQNLEDRILISQQEQMVSALFHYNFSILGTKFSNNSLTSIISADNLDLNLRVNPPDKELLNEYSLEVNNTKIEIDFINADNSINVSTTATGEMVSLNFTTSYTISFLNPVAKTWAIDRLVEDRNIRERIYFPSLINGPRHIFLKNLMIFEDTIIVDQVLQNSSLFERDVLYYDLNLTSLEEEFTGSLIFTKESVKKKGLRIIVPYLIVGETNPMMIKYNANNDLIIKVTDIIDMPLIDVNILLSYYQKPYGTYISNDLILPMSPLFTNENGEVLVRNLPNGNYTIKIYQGERLIKEDLVNANQEVSYITTNEAHFPIVILIMGVISGIFIFLGYIFYIYYKKRQIIT